MLDISSEKLEEYRLLWMRLTEIVRSGSSMLSYTMAVMVTTPFAYEVIAAYNLTMFVIRSIQLGRYEEVEDAIFTLTLFIFYSILLYMFCNSGHYMTVKVSGFDDFLRIIVIYYVTLTKFSYKAPRNTLCSFLIHSISCISIFNFIYLSKVQPFLYKYSY